MAYYDTLASNSPTGLGSRLNQAQVRMHLRCLARVAGLKGRIVEIGPGHGEMARECLGRGMDYVCVDANPSICEMARSLGADAVEAVTPPIPLDDRSADLVYANSVLEHMTDHFKALGLVQEMRRIARPGGAVMIHSPDLLGSGVHFWNSEYSHTFPTSRRRLLQIFQDAGLKPAQADYVCGPLKGIPAIALGFAMRYFPHNIAAVLSLGLATPEQWYKTRTALMRSVLVIGRRSEA